MSPLLIQKARQGVGQEERAADEWRRLGGEVVYSSLSELRRYPEVIAGDEIPVGSVGFVTAVARLQGLDLPKPIDYPDSLQGFLKRDIQRSSLGEARRRVESKDVPFFMKPSESAKLFTGVVVRSEVDLYWTARFSHKTPVHISQFLEFTHEVRAFIADGRILGVRMAPGETDSVTPRDEVVIRAVVDAYEASGEAPAGYAMDFGLVRGDQHVLIEVNDGYSLGRYGLDAIEYIRLLVARWSEIQSQCARTS